MYFRRFGFQRDLRLPSGDMWLVSENKWLAQKNTFELSADTCLVSENIFKILSGFYRFSCVYNGKNSRRLYCIFEKCRDI